LLVENYEFLVYDLICFSRDWRISSWDLKGRVNLSKFFLDKNAFFLNNLMIKIKTKDVFKVQEIRNLFGNILENTINNERIFINHQRLDNLMCNKNDGIILTPNKCIYISKSPFITFKWKYENGNSIDFSVKKSVINENKKAGIFLKTNLYLRIGKTTDFRVRNQKKINHLLFFKIPRCQNNQNRISEFLINKKTSNWCFIKNRNDKKIANSIKIIVNTMETINENLLKDELTDNLLKFELRIKRGKIFKNH
jgi:hypothetical protein